MSTKAASDLGIVIVLVECEGVLEEDLGIVFGGIRFSVYVAVTLQGEPQSV